MHEIRLHGRGGQGAVVASEMLASMYFKSGKFAQAFPAFGVERRGAPVLAYTRVDDHPIEIHYGIYEPDHLIVLDQTIIDIVDVSVGLKKNGLILINSVKDRLEYDQFKEYKVETINVNKIALKHGLGSASLPIVNTAILGAYAALSGQIPKDLVAEEIIQSAPSKMENNAAAAVEAFEAVIRNGS